MPLWAEEPVPVAVRTRSSGHRDGFLAAFRFPDRPLAAFSDRESQVRSSFSDVLSLSPETISRNNAHSYDVITYMHVALGRLFKQHMHARSCCVERTVIAVCMPVSKSSFESYQKILQELPNELVIADK